jgi:hypothetical protein
MNKLKQLWNAIPEGVKRVLHTAWQAAGGVLIAHLLVAHSTQDVKASVAVALAAGLAALKAAILMRKS